ncbi:DUF1642 domain-containing protein [Streptococcus suis]|uniref:DUF1642 domain-containing protein n=1 Tax=Streptococcus suis TaxID=1307 RepID=UPI000D0B7D7D|nr:DUF1642 domain-containing protein [Streptococcus suis]MBS7854643.1 DUF1642 domain-containing protein [Streptococcus suis]MBS7977702.1 DUF1642 domain-containing protein [Streptococcus suis]MDG3109162.1 DUF1642 domain-containing protein [Streptococcus suis]MDG3147986.1 DUF1642 domain-containing protein [Streptococcus suis]MDG3170306.1 DUF1642 domain-containing protein [Streptococcus suis]
MNKQEAIEKVKEHGEFYSNMFGGTVKMVPVGPIIDIIYQIPEPQNVVVPKVVAEWIEKTKSMGWSLRAALINSKDKVDEWLSVFGNQDTFARAWLDGYEVEKERLYTVEIPNPHSGNYTYLHRSGSVIKLVTTQFENWKARDYNHFTEAEIKQDFEWAWQWAEAVEVE